ncbi:MAG: type II toxin-antitoxin system RelB/DinJ family antitoxin [Lactobacillus paragasseri]|nr:type II toxin-antitoxin system RelB/DinJ family antitoxin [Lactobacillus paragasseri]
MSKQRLVLMVDDDLKKEFKRTVENMGLTSTAAVTLFMQQVVNQKRIPFNPTYTKK